MSVGHKSDLEKMAEIIQLEKKRRMPASKSYINSANLYSLNRIVIDNVYRDTNT